MAGFDPEKAKYLFNPVNSRVMINTERKRRLCPDLVLCNRLDASDVADDPKVLIAKDEDYRPQPDESEEQTVAEQVQSGFTALLLQIDSSEDKGELRQIAADLGLSLTKTMKVATMRAKLVEHIDDLETVA